MELQANCIIASKLYCMLTVLQANSIASEVKSVAHFMLRTLRATFQAVDVARAMVSTVNLISAALNLTAFITITFNKTFPTITLALDYTLLTNIRITMIPYKL